MTIEGVGEQLVRPQFGLYKFEWPDTHEVEFHLAHGDWIDLLRANGFEIDRLVELFATAAGGDAHVLQVRHGRVGAQVAARGDLGRA